MARRTGRTRSRSSRPQGADPAGGPTPGARPSLVDRLQTYARRPAVRVTALVIVLGVFALHGLVVARLDTPTVDEFVHTPQGYYYLRTGDLRFDIMNPPLLKMAMALPWLALNLELDTDVRWRTTGGGWGPWIFGRRFMEVNGVRYLDAFFLARIVVLVLAVGLGVLVFRRATTLLTPLGALAALVLYGTLSPMVAHGALATLDLGVTALLFAAFVALDRFAVRTTWPWAALAGTLLGLSLVAKGTAALFVPLAPVVVALRWAAWSRPRRLVIGGVAAVAAGWLAIQAVYGFSGFPLPPALLEGIRFRVAENAVGEYPAFLNGRWSQTGWWYYYLVALGLKLPLATLVLLLVGLAVVVRGGRRELAMVVVALPALLLVHVMSFHYAKYYGIRFILPALPFLVLLAGRGVDGILRAGRYGVVVVGTLLAWQVAAFTLAAPHHLAYFNELAGGPDRARRLLLDSNLDWGQDLGRLKTYMDAQGAGRICLGYFGHVDPGLYGIEFSLPPTRPSPGRCAISANFLAGYPYAITYAGGGMLGVPPGAWSWFDRLPPTARVGRSIYVFDVTPEDVERLTRAPR